MRRSSLRICSDLHSLFVVSGGVRFQIMTTAVIAEQVAGLARYTFRLRLSSTALACLEGEWARCRWVWNECVAVSRKVHKLNKEAETKTTCGPAQLDKLLTGARRSMSWLREGSSVAQQQVVRDFGTSRAKACKGHRGEAADEAAGGDAADQAEA
jgi:putative transposase